MQPLAPLAPRSLFALCATAALAFAQGDECTDPLPITVGSYGPFTNVAATTSFPWPCASGGNDVWFVARGDATGGTATFDTCGSGYDTCIQVFDGTGGCGNLVNLGCNDDSCGTRSSLTVTVTPGLLMFIRVGGWNGASGTFVLNVSGALAPATGFAGATEYGEGCYNNRASFYEFINDPANFDLSNTSFTMLPSSGGYAVVPGLAGFVTPSPNATILTLGDDSVTTVALTNPFPYGGTSTPVLAVYSNGFVATGSGNTTIGTIVTANFFNSPDTAWRNWHDYDPGAGGQVTFEEVGGIAYCTWTNVPDWNVSGSQSTFQFQFDTSSGSVTFAFQQMSLTGGGGGGNGHMVGYSPGGPSLVPEMIDISAALPATFAVQANDSFELVLSASERPVLGSTIMLDTGNVPAASGIGAQIFSFAQVFPGVDLAGIGMAGCRRYLIIESSVITIPSGGTASMSLSLPANNAFAGQHMYTQSAALVPGVNALGALSSNGVDLRIDMF